MITIYWIITIGLWLLFSIAADRGAEYIFDSMIIDHLLRFLFCMLWPIWAAILVVSAWCDL